MNRIKMMLPAIVLLFFTNQSGLAQGVEATQPTIMVLPADGLLNRLGFLKRINVKGVDRTFQDYEGAFIESPELRLAISQIQERFAAVGFPLKDLEFSLKSINTQAAFDQSDNIQLDMKATLLKSAQPDIYLDLDYFFAGSGLTKALSFNLRAIDAYTNQVISTASNSGVSSINNNLVDNLVEQVEMNLQNLQSGMKMHFSDLRLNGRIIALRISNEARSPINDFRRDRCGDKPYTHLILDYVKKNTVNGQHHLMANAAKEITYDLIRIPLYDKDGYAMGATEWAYQLVTYLENTCKLAVIDNTTRLGEAHILLLSK
jgi:hypothetical protein